MIEHPHRIAALTAAEAGHRCGSAVASWIPEEVWNFLEEIGHVRTVRRPRPGSGHGREATPEGLNWLRRALHYG